MKRWGDDNSVDIHDGGVVNGGITSGGDDKREASKLSPLPFLRFKNNRFKNIIYFLNIVKEAQVMKRWGDHNKIDVHDGGRVNGGIRNGGRKKREACKLRKT